MLDLAQFAVLAATAVAAAFVGSVAGFGLGVVLLPAVVFFLGIKEAIPILSISLLSGAFSRALAYRREVALPVAGWYLLGAVPMAATGAYLFTVAPPTLLTRLLGVVLLAMVVWRRVRPSPPRRLATPWFLPIGAVFGFLVGLISGLGPLMAPFFLAHGLRKGSFVGTIATIALCVQTTKLIVFSRSDVLTHRVILYGLGFIPFIILGTLIGRRFMNRLSERVFEHIIEGMMLLAGGSFLIRG
jgi:hypothetical protein